MAYRHIRENPQFDAYFLAAQGKQVKKVTEAIADDARRACPYDSGDLYDSIDTRYPGKLRGVVIVGTDHWHPTEYGSPPHEIRSRGKWPLRNIETGDVFGRVVDHPGTPEQPFMRPALFRKRRLSP
jgi:hypothetical protein